MSCSGLHCAGCSGGAIVPPAALGALLGGAWMVTHLVEVTVMSVVCAALGWAAMEVLFRRSDRRDVRKLDGRSLLITRPDALPPRPRRAELEGGTHYHVHYHGVPPALEQAPAWRPASVVIPSQAEEITR